MLTNASYACYITSVMAYVPSSVYGFLGRMAYVPSSVYKNHVLANVPHVPNIQKISNTGTDTDTDIKTLSNSNTHSLSFNIIYTPKIQIISHYKSSYPKAIVSYWFEILELMSSAGTIIMQGFDPSIITRGCSGYLRQEFREHEILNDITRLRYKSLLPDHIEGSTRNSIIRQYQQ